MKKKNNDNKVIKYPKSYNFSIGFVIIGVMFIYMLYHLFTYLTAETVTIYEVSQGSISSNLEYNALAIREETAYTAEQSGNVLYLAENFSRVGVKSDIYAIDESGTIVTNLPETSISEMELEASDRKSMEANIDNFVSNFNTMDFYKVYTFKTELESEIEQMYNLSAMKTMSDEVSNAISSGSFHIYKCPKPGLVVYSVDGMEDLSLENYTVESFDITKSTPINLKSQASIKEGQPLFKIVSSDYWYLVCEIDNSLYDELKEEHYIQIEFLEDETRTWTSISLEEKYGKKYLVMRLDDSMSKYAANRFVHIKVCNNDISGLKIPNSSIVEKEFYKIPKSYFYQGDNSSSLGLMVRESSDTNRFITPTIYYESEDDYYIDDEKITSGDILLKANSSDKYIVGADIGRLKGVYNVNKGYAIFKQIEIRYQNEDYSIIKTGTDYGISMYDHIVLQGDAVEENTIIN